MKKWVCSVCGYVYEGEQAPEKCPQCGGPSRTVLNASPQGLPCPFKAEPADFAPPRVTLGRNDRPDLSIAQLSPSNKAPLSRRLVARLCRTDKAAIFGLERLKGE